jgi:hypothetical protein
MGMFDNIKYEDKSWVNVETQKNKVMRYDDLIAGYPVIYGEAIIHHQAA